MVIYLSTWLVTLCLNYVQWHIMSYCNFLGSTFHPHADVSFDQKKQAVPENVKTSQTGSAEEPKKNPKKSGFSISNWIRVNFEENQAMGGPHLA